MADWYIAYNGTRLSVEANLDSQDKVRELIKALETVKLLMAEEKEDANNQDAFKRGEA